MKDTSIAPKTHPRIDSIEETTDTLTSRAGLALFARYLDSIGLSWFVERWFGPIRKSGKGVSAVECLRQVILFMADGTSRHLSHFDRLKADEGYAATVERRPAGLVSSHSVKRFFGAISWARMWLLRRLLQELFLWRLNIEKPSLVILDVDAMVMDNDEAEKRQGVRPTYKRVKGFRQNTAFYYVALLAFALYESFKADVADPVLPRTVYPTTFRRRFLDVAGKIVRHAGRIVLKVTRAAMDGLKLAEVWQRCLSPPRIPTPV